MRILFLLSLFIATNAMRLKARLKAGWDKVKRLGNRVRAGSQRVAESVWNIRDRSDPLHVPRERLQNAANPPEGLPNRFFDGPDIEESKSDDIYNYMDLPDELRPRTDPDPFLGRRRFFAAYELVRLEFEELGTDEVNWDDIRQSIDFLQTELSYLDTHPPQERVDHRQLELGTGLECYTALERMTKFLRILIDCRNNQGRDDQEARQRNGRAQAIAETLTDIMIRKDEPDAIHQWAEPVVLTFATGRGIVVIVDPTYEDTHRLTGL